MTPSISDHPKSELRVEPTRGKSPAVFNGDHVLELACHIFIDLASHILIFQQSI